MPNVKVINYIKGQCPSKVKLYLTRFGDGGVGLGLKGILVCV